MIAKNENERSRGFGESRAIFLLTFLPRKGFLERGARAYDPAINPKT
jgi:hypothetical protein